MSDSRGGWELTKENIQPLSSGRRMADLTGALPTNTAGGLTDQLLYEEHHLKEIEKLEALAKQDTSDDPLQVWINVVKYFEQHFPNMANNIKERYTKILLDSLQRFYGDTKYMNDIRYVNICITSLNASNVKAIEQIGILSGFLEEGEGLLVSETYIRLAELYRITGDTKKALDILKKGIANNAQPKEKLLEMLTHIQECWAQDYAKQLQNGTTNDSDVRNFASSVPIVGDNNEAISIRQNLQPAAPTNTSRSITNARQNTAPSKMPLYNEENTTPQTSVSGNRHFDARRVESLNNAESDRENRLEACRWNSTDTELHNPAIPEPPEKLKLYVEPEILPASSSSSKSQNKRALQERKEDSEHSKLDAIPNLQPQVPASEVIKAAPVANEKTTDVSQGREINSEVERETSRQATGVSSSFKWRRNYNPDTGKNNFFENIKYKPLPPGGRVSRLMLKCDKYFEKREEEMKKREVENSESKKLQEEINRLTESNQKLAKHVELIEKLLKSSQENEAQLKEQHDATKLKLSEKEKGLQRLESQNEDLMNQLTRMTTTNNVMESQFHKLEYEKRELEQKVRELRNHLEEERQMNERLGEEILAYKRKLVMASQESNIKRIKQEPLYDDSDESEFRRERSQMGKKPSFVDIDVRSRTTEIYSPSSPSSSTEQGTDEASRFRSEETTTVEPQQQSLAPNSFMPDDIGDDKSAMMDMSIEPSAMPKKVFGMVERPTRNDMLNITPAAPPPTDFDFPPPCFETNNFRRMPKLALYESFSSFSESTAKNARETVSSKRNDFVRNLQNLSENRPPMMEPNFQARPTIPSDENAYVVRLASADNLKDDPPQEHFRRPALPSDENANPTALRRPRRSVLLAQLQQGDSSDEDDDIILRRHQQTGIDLNISNLTTALALGPRPLINSTPEKEKTFRDIPTMAPRNLAHHDADDIPVSDSLATRTSRFSILNEPPLNLSTIQETSRENRSRSTTGSSSGNTMSSTRFGMGSISTQLYGHSASTARSASVPRSESRSASHGYYSDTNTMQ